MELTCPKCHGSMRSYERSGILVDQCTECRGVFLDRGELDKLIDAEAAYQQPVAPPAARTPSPQSSPWGTPQSRDHEERHPDDLPYRDGRHKDDRYKDDRYKDEHGYGRKRKRSFLDELFD